MATVRDQIIGALRANGESRVRACRMMGITTRTLTKRLKDPDSFKAGEIRQLRKLIPDEICDGLTR